MYSSVFKALVVGSLHIEFVYPTLMIVLGQANTQTHDAHWISESLARPFSGWVMSSVNGYRSIGHGSFTPTRSCLLKGRFLRRTRGTSGPSRGSGTTPLDESFRRQETASLLLYYYNTNFPYNYVKRIITESKGANNTFKLVLTSRLRQR